MFITKKKLENLLFEEREKVYNEINQRDDRRRIEERLDKLSNDIWRLECALDDHINKNKRKREIM